MTTPTVEPSREPKDELLPTPTPTPEVKETPALGTPVASTPTPEPTVYVTADPSQDISSPLYGQIIGIDPCRDNTKRPEEAENNLILANHLKRYLENQGAKVVLGRTEEDKGKVEDSARAKIFREAECTYVVRLKCNYINAKTSACYVKATKKNKDFGQKMIDAYVLTTGMKKQSNKKNGVQVEDDPVASKCGCPCVAYLLGNWENEQDYANLHDEVFQRRARADPHARPHRTGGEHHGTVIPFKQKSLDIEAFFVSSHRRSSLGSSLSYSTSRFSGVI